MELKNVSHKEWEALCKEVDRSSIYLDPRWLELLQSVYPRLKIHRLVCREAPGKIHWLLPLVEIKPLGKRRPMLISLPFGNYGGFMIPRRRKQGLTENELAPLVRFFEKSPASILEIREKTETHPGFHVHTGFKRFEIVFPEEVDALWERVITGNVRTSVRKADKSHLEIIFDQPQAIKIFQKIYETNASFHGTPVHAAKWYETMALLFRPEAQILLAKHGDRYIGALLILHSGGISLLHGAVTDPSYRNIPATDKLIWSALEHIVQNKLSRVFDFGRTRPEPGKIFFKRKWGGTEKPVYYSYLMKPGAKIPAILPENPAYNVAIQIWRRLPLVLQRSLGPFFRSRIPT